MKQNSSKAVGIWLMIGVVMVFIQIIIGGITRLTGSGLSITKWEIVTGTLPPLNESSWQQEFELYRQSPQYQMINKGMSLSEFKFIYFWEYFHRLWARLMGFVFAIPFVWFWAKGFFSSELKKRLIIIFLLASLVASFGWIMVASGLVSRPWVNAYKLTLHLSLAIVLYAYLLWTALLEFFPLKKVPTTSAILKLGHFSLLILSVQLILGGLMSGMKAGLFFPTFPDMNGAYIPASLFEISNWTMEAFTHYDSQIFAVTAVQFFHRMTAYFLVVVVLWFYFKLLKTDVHAIKHLLPVALLAQVLLGIITVMLCQGQIPVLWGVLHQAGAIVLLTVLLSVIYFLSFKKKPAHFNQ